MTSKATVNVDNTLSTITAEFDAEIEFAAESDVTVLNVYVQNTETVAATITVANNAAIEGNVLTLTLDEAIAPEGTTKYTIEIPAGWIVKKGSDKAFAGKKLTYTVKIPFKIKNITPASGSTVEALENIVIEYNEKLTTYGTKTVLENVVDGTQVEVTVTTNNNIATITPNAPVANGTYKLVNLGYIVSNSSWVAPAELPEYTITVDAPLPTLNETAVFDFTNNAWGIQEGLDPVSFAGTKTAGEYTDGTKTIKIDPTANKGQFYYENGYLRIQKPGSKIVLPAFDFAVEKIEVVGHASATSYANVDMNVYVDGNAVSTACVGSTATYTYEIAAENQEAGNVYELVIGSNAGNYSSVMYITYIKVYPRDNKLEAPEIDLASGVYVGEQTVNVHSATVDLEGVTNVTYYYTTDGNEPTVEDEETDGEIIISESCTLKVIVELTYGDKVYVSASSSAEYIISDEVTYHRATAVESGSYFIVADGNVATPIEGTTLPAVEATVDGNDVTSAVYYAVTLEETDGGYNIMDVNGNYIYNTMMNADRLYAGSMPTAWTIEIADDENSTAMIVCNNYVLVYQNGVFCTVPVAEIPADAVLPTFYGTHETGIDGIYGDKLNGMNVNEGIYDLQGRKLEKITNGGIYIVNGKKVLVK